MGKISKLFFLSVIFQASAFQIQAQQIVQPVSQTGNALEICGTTKLHDELLQNSETFRTQIARNEELIRAALQSKPQARTNGTVGQVMVIPLVVHIIHTGEAIGTGNNISDAQVHSAITALNDLFRKKTGTYGAGAGADMEVEFQLATRDPNCNPTSGIVRVNGSTVLNYANYGVKLQSVGAEDAAIKNLSRWPNTDYYNIWVVSNIDNGGGTAGYAYLPGAPAYLDGTVILNRAFGTIGTVSYNMSRGHTLAHELGHAFNLYHTFEGDNGGTSCPPATNGCGSGQGDCVADTEPHRRSSSAFNWSCPAGAINSCTGAPIGNVYKNYMDYNIETCRTEFTQNQKDRVRAAITLFRPGLLNSQSLNSGSLSVPLAATCFPSAQVVSNNFGIGIYSVNIGNYTVRSDGTVGENTFLADRTCNQQFGLASSGVIPVSVTTGTANNENVAVYLDYNNNGSFTDPGELIFTSLNAKTHSGTFSPPSGCTRNAALRLRVISDFVANTISGPCYQPQYGQIEEYTVSFISPLPVSLTGFTARRHLEQVVLEWQTEQEQENEYFEVERSADSENWKPIGKLNGAGNSALSQQYSFTDQHPFAGANYYRLKQVDRNGTESYSAIRFVRFDSGARNVQVYPNPGSGKFTVTLGYINQEPLLLKVMNAKGQEILRREYRPEQELPFTISDFPAGIYLLEIQSLNEFSRLKFIKQ